MPETQSRPPEAAPALEFAVSPELPESCWICGWLALPPDALHEEYDAQRIADMELEDLLAPGWHTRHAREGTCLANLHAAINARRG